MHASELMIRARIWSGCHGGGWPRIGLIWLLVGFAWCGWPAAARADLQFDVSLGYDDISHEASWVPVTCEVFNDGPPFQAVFELNSPYGASQVERLRLDLPTNTRKRFVIPVFSRGYESWSARLLDERGRVRAEKQSLSPRRNVSWQTFLLGGMPRNFSGMPVLSKIQSNRPGQSIQPEISNLQPAGFPDNPIALEGLDALYLNSNKALELNVNQSFAILAWIQAGGHLMLTVDQILDINATPWLRSLVPLDLDRVAAVPLNNEFETWVRHASVQTWPGISGVAPGASDATRAASAPPPMDPNLAKRYGLTNTTTPQKRRTPTFNSPASMGVSNTPYARIPNDPNLAGVGLPVATGGLRGAVPLLSVGQVPLMVERHWGHGKVTVLLFNPEREPFRSWENRTLFWTKLTGLPAKEGTVAPYGGRNIDGLFGAMLDSRQVRKLPVGWLLVLLLAYLAIIGPVDYYLLKRLRRPMLTWITFPAYVVLFSGLIYFIGYKLRAGVSEWNEMNLVDILPREDRAELRGRTYVSIYSPANVRYPLAGTQQFTALRGELSNSPQGNQTEIESLANGFRAHVLVPVWTSQLYEQDWWELADVPLSAGAACHGDRLQLALTNHLDRELTALRVVAAGNVYELGKLSAHQSTNYALSSLPGIALSTYFGADCAQKIGRAMSMRGQAFGGASEVTLSDFPRYAAAASFYSLMPDDTSQSGYAAKLRGPWGLDLSPLEKRGDVIVLAWDNGHALQAPLNQFNPLRTHRDTLLRLAVPVANLDSTAEAPLNR
jgi:hypothetical protein